MLRNILFENSHVIVISKVNLISRNKILKVSADFLFVLLKSTLTVASPISSFLLKILIEEL